MFNYVEFTQEKLHIAGDTTVNPYLRCNGVLSPSSTIDINIYLLSRGVINYLALCLPHRLRIRSLT